MSSNSVINFKVFLRNQGAEEARRFAVDTDAVTSFLFVKGKLQSVFPLLRDNDYKLTWKDTDGDEITIASDEDLITALTEMTDRVKVLYVTVLSRHPDVEFVAEVRAPPHVICDNCECYITGFRYKCMQCPDFDLCSKCESKGLHPEHAMLRVANSEMPIPRCTRKMMHHFNHSFRKAAWNAACRGGPKGRGHCDKGAPGGSKDETKPKSNEEGPQAAGGCPFAASAGVDINLQDVHELARQHVAPLLQGISSAAANQGEGLADLIKNALDGLFRAPNSTQNNNTEKSAQDAPASQTASNTNAEPTSPPQSAAKTTPMEVIDNSQQTSSKAQEARRPEGWTIVDNDQVTEVTPPAAAPQNNNNLPPLSTAPPFTQRNHPLIVQGLAQMHEMGFSNDGDFLADLLIRYEGNVAMAVRHMLENN